MQQNVCMFYITCYSYKKLWEPYLKLRDKYFTNKIKLYICVDKMNENDEIKLFLEKKYENIKFLIFNEVSNIKETGNYFHRYLYYLNNITEDLITYIYDDMFFCDKVNINNFNELCKLMNNSDEIKMIKLLYYNIPNNISNIFNYNELNFLKYDNSIDEYIISGQPHIIKKNILIEISNFCLYNINKQTQYCGPQVFEVYGTIFFRNKSCICLTIYNENIFHIYKGGISNSYGIVAHGKIENDTIEKIKNEENIIIKCYKNNFIFKIDNKFLENSSHKYLEIAQQNL